MINVIGLGYIGLPTALMLASHGNQVVGTDYNEKIVNQLNDGGVTFKEEGLLDLFFKARKSKIVFSSSYQKTDFYIISVPTPYDENTKKINPDYVIKAFETVLDVCKKGTIIVVESTVSPGTIDKFLRPLISKHGFKDGKDIYLAHAPERIIPGNMIYELINNNRTIGADNKKIAERVKSVYSSFCKGEIICTDIKTAELTKVIENTYRAVNIAFANELLKLCDKTGMNVYEIIKICNMHPRVNILQPGPGVGGHCIPVDPWFLVGDYPDETPLIKQSLETNESMPRFVLDKMKTIMANNGLKDFSKVGVYGLSYKENVDDIRESPSIQLLNILTKDELSKINVYDPFVNVKLYKNQFFDLNNFLKDVDFVVVMVKHKEIRENQKSLYGKIVLDTQNVIFGKKIYKI